MICENKKIDTIINLIDTEYFDKTSGVLTIPNGVEEINGKFYIRRKNIQNLYKIKEVRLPNTVKKIGRYAFRRTGIVNIQLPLSIQEIELGAFELCSNLIEVSIVGKKVPLIEKDSFIACENLETLRNSLGDIDVKKDFRISNTAFSTCYKLLNKQNKWLLVVDQKPNNIFEKILSIVSKVFSYNGMESIKNKF